MVISSGSHPSLTAPGSVDEALPAAIAPAYPFHCTSRLCVSAPSVFTFNGRNHSMPTLEPELEASRAA